MSAKPSLGDIVSTEMHASDETIMTALPLLVSHRLTNPRSMQCLTQHELVYEEFDCTIANFYTSTRLV